MYYLGIDFGTSGARAIVVDEQKTIQVEAKEHIKEHLSRNWAEALFNLIEQIPGKIRAEIKAIAINGTSSTVLLCDRQGNPLDKPILYNDKRGVAVREKLTEIAPENHVTLSPTSSLAKLLWWEAQPIFAQASFFLHQADWLAFLLHGKLGISDYHNALKLGYDIENLCYPDWLNNLPIKSLLPQVLPPGTPVSEVKDDLIKQFNLQKNCLVCTGTTDSIAAFIASSANQPGEAVTSLGSTLVLKLLSDKRVEDAKYGIYSHRLGNLWLTGGASNTGGAVLREFFSDEELARLSSQIDGNVESPLTYYPLLAVGDRFPINDPNLPPQLEPRPDNPVEFLHGLLESIARIEARGYQLLQDLGATQLSRVYTAGGGAKNATWRKIRQRHLQVPVTSSENTAAAFGTALLAKNC
ncbi:FGGY-family carbohydrate kinase [Oscillatoria salina]|uniref:FGGY-family carbohydrate kinase n=1 Tax=Oscillatoria salina TaxID=331517 RepID=UPI001CCED801|nr:FGGY-family carbohydrate kinase [Oscillatoria salina]MBZ8179422.1 FGGY-family carbohydrate kinase [Oscillatoria salina IIICB1]